MHTITVCVGSSCHLRGAPAVIAVFQSLIRQYHLEQDVVLKADFCMNQCTAGVAVRFDDRLVTGVNQENAAALFREYIR